MTMAPALIEAARGRFDALIADRGYDSNAIRAAVQTQGAKVVIPSTHSRKTAIPYDRAMEIGFVHPPLGMNLYVIQGVAKEVPIGRVFRGVAPFLASDFLHLLMLIFVPAMVYWLPEVLR